MQFRKTNVIPAQRLNLRAYIERFLKSGSKCAEIVNLKDHYKDADSCYVSFFNAIRKYGYPCRMFVRSDRVFIARTDMEDEDGQADTMR